MSVIKWSETGSRTFETGLSKGVLYKYNKTEKKYDTAAPWNGLTAVTSSPSGAEPTDLWADDIKYATLRSAETYGGTIEAYAYPEEFESCDGSASLTDGVTIGQQGRDMFGLSYKTRKGSDTDPSADGAYIIHLVYGATANPSERNYQSVNDSPEAVAFSWEFTTTPVEVSGFKPTSYVEIDSSKVDKTKLEALEAILYGSDSKEAYLPLPDEIKTIIST